MAVHFGIHCRCLGGNVVGERETIGKQLRFLFPKAQDKEIEAIKIVVAEEFWSGPHTHDGLVLERFLNNYIQVLGAGLWGVRTAMRYGRDETYLLVCNAIDSVSVDPEFGLAIGILGPNQENKKVKLNKA